MIRQLRDLPLHSVNLTGMFMALYHDGRPVTFVLDGQHFLPVFSTPQKMLAALEIANPDAPISPKQITDGAAFVASLEGRVRLMLDPWVNEEGNTRFLELTPEHLAN